jgi:hypothetical protein
MMDVGPSEEAIAKTPKEAAVPPFEGAKFTSAIARKVPRPQMETYLLDFSGVRDAGMEVFVWKLTD